MIGSELGGNMNVLFGTSGVGSENLDSSLRAAYSRLNGFHLTFLNAGGFVFQRKLKGSDLRSSARSRDIVRNVSSYFVTFPIGADFEPSADDQDQSALAREEEGF